MRLVLTIGLLLLTLSSAVGLPAQTSGLVATRGHAVLADLTDRMRIFLPLPSPTSGAAPRLAQPQLSYDNPDTSTDPQSTEDSENRTAIYDIAAHTVYLPNGGQLEAHSGLGPMLDNPRYAEVKGGGPTPPNVYNLTLRAGLFHGVLAIRLKPVAGSTMFGRDNFLAHTYMLGPSGQSFGCVSFKDYPKFLQAYQRGEIHRLVVVPHLESVPPIKGMSQQTAANIATHLRWGRRLAIKRSEDRVSQEHYIVLVMTVHKNRYAVGSS